MQIHMENLIALRNVRTVPIVELQLWFFSLSIYKKKKIGQFPLTFSHRASSPWKMWKMFPATLAHSGAPDSDKLSPKNAHPQPRSLRCNLTENP